MSIAKIDNITIFLTPLFLNQLYKTFAAKNVVKNHNGRLELSVPFTSNCLMGILTTLVIEKSSFINSMQQ